MFEPFSGFYEKIIRFKISPQLPGAKRTEAWYHHGSDTPTFPRAVLHHKDAILCTFMHTTVPHCE